MYADVLGIVVLGIAEVATVEENDDPHDLAQAQLRLSGALMLAALEQELDVDGLKRLAKVIGIAKHGDELAHGDLRMVQAVFRNTATIRVFLWAGKLSCLSRILVSLSKGGIRCMLRKTGSKWPS